MRLIKQFLAIAIMFAIPAIRNPIWYLAISIIPCAFFFVFWLLGGMKLCYHAILGALVVFSINAGLVSLPQLAVGLKSRKLQEMFVASPVHPIIYALGIAFSRFIYVLPLIMIAFVVLIVKGLLSGLVIPYVLLILILTWFTGSMIGFTIATYINNVLYISSIANLLGLLLNLLPPVYYPVSLIPQRFHLIALLFPTSSAAQIIRAASHLGDAVSIKILFCWIVLLGYAISSIILVVKKARWREV